MANFQTSCSGFHSTPPAYVNAPYHKSKCATIDGCDNQDICCTCIEPLGTCKDKCAARANVSSVPSFDTKILPGISSTSPLVVCSWKNCWHKSCVLSEDNPTCLRITVSRPYRTVNSHKRVKAYADHAMGCMRCLSHHLRMCEPTLGPPQCSNTAY